MWKTNEFLTTLTQKQRHDVKVMHCPLVLFSLTLSHNEEMDVPLGSQPKKELTSASLFITLSMAYHHEWSQSYIKGLTFEEHHVNNEWFNKMLSMLKDDGELYVPMLDKSFNKSGEEVSS